MNKRYLIALIFISFGVNAETLITASYKIEIGSCPEGYVSCDTIPFDVKNVETGMASSFIGGTLHTLCADGETPCRFLGYQFVGDIGNYYIYNDGTLAINDDENNTVLTEQGAWSE